MFSEVKGKTFAELDWNNKVEFQNYKDVPASSNTPSIRYGVSFTAPANGMFFFTKPYTTNHKRHLYLGTPPRNEPETGGIFGLRPKNSTLINLGGGIFWASVILDDTPTYLTYQDERDFQKIIPCNKGDILYTHTKEMNTLMPCCYENYFGTWTFVPYKEV